MDFALPAYAVASLQNAQKFTPLQFYRRACGIFWHSARATVAENCRRCCLDNAESAAHRTITVQFALLAHRASLASSRLQSSGPEPCNGPCSAHSATGCAAAQSPARSRHHAARSNGHEASEWSTAAPGWRPELPRTCPLRRTRLSLLGSPSVRLTYLATTCNIPSLGCIRCGDGDGGCYWLTTLGRLASLEREPMHHS
jgi:hypothetical protein